MKNQTLTRMLLTLIFLASGATLKAQTISSLADLNSATKAVYCSTDAVKLTAASTGATSYTWQRYAGIGITGSPTTVAGTTATLNDATITTTGYYTYSPAVQIRTVNQKCPIQLQCTYCLTLMRQLQDLRLPALVQ